MGGVARGAERDRPVGWEAELESCGTGTGADPAVLTAAQRAGVDLVKPRRCLAKRPDGFCSWGAGVGSDSGEGVWRARDGLRRLGAAGDPFGDCFSAFWRLPRGLDGVSCSSSDEGLERGLRDFSDLGVAEGAAGTALAVALRCRGLWRWAFTGFESVMIPGVRVLAGVSSAAGGAAE